MYCHRCLGAIEERADGESPWTSKRLCAGCGQDEKSCTCEPPRCANCRKHKASVVWIGKQGMLEYVHGGSDESWCECCALRAQLEYAREQARRATVLEKKIAESKCE